MNFADVERLEVDVAGLQSETVDVLDRIDSLESQQQQCGAAGDTRISDRATGYGMTTIDRENASMDYYAARYYGPFAGSMVRKPDDVGYDPDDTLAPQYMDSVRIAAGHIYLGPWTIEVPEWDVAQWYKETYDPPGTYRFPDTLTPLGNPSQASWLMILWTVPVALSGLPTWIFSTQNAKKDDGSWDVPAPRQTGFNTGAVVLGLLERGHTRESDLNRGIYKWTQYQFGDAYRPMGRRCTWTSWAGFNHVVQGRWQFLPTCPYHNVPVAKPPT